MEENKFFKSARNKTKKQLIEILTNKEEYNPELVSAAEVELRNRMNKKSASVVKENILHNLKESHENIKNSQTVKSTGKTIKKTFAIILIIIGVPLTFFSLTSALIAGPHTFVPLMIFSFIIGAIILGIGIKML